MVIRAELRSRVDDVGISRWGTYTAGLAGQGQGKREASREGPSFPSCRALPFYRHRPRSRRIHCVPNWQFKYSNPWSAGQPPGKAARVVATGGGLIKVSQPGGTATPHYTGAAQRVLSPPHAVFPASQAGNINIATAEAEGNTAWRRGLDPRQAQEGFAAQGPEVVSAIAVRLGPVLCNRCHPPNATAIFGLWLKVISNGPRKNRRVALSVLGVAF